MLYEQVLCIIFVSDNTKDCVIFTKKQEPASLKQITSFSHENSEFKMSVHVRRGKVIVYYGKRMSILSRGPSEISYIVF